MRWSLNTARYSLSSLKLNVFGVPIIGSTVATIGETLTGDIMYGNGPVGLGKVIGTISGDIELGFIPEEDDNLLSAIGMGFSEIPIGMTADFYEPANPAGIYSVQADSIWITDTNLDAAREGAVIKRKFKSQTPISWNGITAIDMALRGQDPSLVGAIFQTAGLLFSP